MWCVSALRQINTNGIALTIGPVVFAKLLTQSRGLDAHDGIEDGIERFGTIEDLQSDIVTLQPFTATGKSFIDKVFQEPLPTL